MTIEQLKPALAAPGGMQCAALPVIGDPTHVDATGTHLRDTVRSLWDKVFGIGNNVPVFLSGWIARRESSTPALWLNQIPLRSSATLDELERPTGVEYFTPATSEWVNVFVLDAPPVFVAKNFSQTSSSPRTESVGVETVTWLRDFLSISQERACAVAHVPAATFYMWRKRPQSVVRPSSIADGVRLRSSLELVIAHMGEAEARRAVQSGFPSIVDRLGQPETWSEAVQEILELAQPQITAVKRASSASEYLEQLRVLDESDSGETSNAILGAQQMSPEQIAEAEAWGWGHGR